LQAVGCAYARAYGKNNMASVSVKKKKSSGSKVRAPSTKFSVLQDIVPAWALSAVADLGFTDMTPVQAASIRLFLSHKDMMVQACTGSGKTLAFLIPIFTMLCRMSTPLQKNQVGSIVISPTRELATQTHKVAMHFHSFLGATDASKHCAEPLLLVGGTDLELDFGLVRDKGANLIIATPGRLLHVMGKCDELDFREFEVLVLDEADTLLDLGFENTINSILKMLPKQRRTGLFSATMTREVKELARAGLRNPATVSVAVKRSNAASGHQEVPTQLTNKYMVVESDEKLSQMMAFLEKHTEQKFMIFFSTCNCVNFFTKIVTHLVKQKPEMVKQDFMVHSLHGKMTHKQRTQAFKSFGASNRGALLCTDVAARGIDVPDISWIIQFDPPKDPDFYVHRIGRTARAGRKGSALSLLRPNEEAYVDFLQKRNVPMTAMNKADSVEDVLSVVKKLVINDRDMLNKGTQAFVSFIRAYKEHRCQYIFQFKELNAGSVARSYALLKLPKMPELKFDDVDFEKTDIRTSTITFKDKTRQKVFEKSQAEKREKQMEEEKKQEKKRAENKLKSNAWKAEQEKKRKRTKRSNQGRHKIIVEEWNELAEEERLHKKLKKGKITKEEYQKAIKSIGMSDDDEDFGSD
jgi:ATP-dependent RNA helicase DDX55/SPB4